MKTFAEIVLLAKAGYTPAEIAAMPDEPQVAAQDSQAEATTETASVDPAGAAITELDEIRAELAAMKQAMQAQAIIQSAQNAPTQAENVDDILANLAVRQPRNN